MWDPFVTVIIDQEAIGVQLEQEMLIGGNSVEDVIVPKEVSTSPLNLSSTSIYAPNLPTKIDGMEWFRF